MARAEGFYWVKRDIRTHIYVALFRNDEWMLGDIELPDEGDGLTVIAGPIEPPAEEVGATWKARYAATLKAQKKLLGRKALLGWDYLTGYYWVHVRDRPGMFLARYFEGWGYVAEDDELNGDPIQVIDGPLVPPQIRNPHVT
jgi:hypothetical protein